MLSCSVVSFYNNNKNSQVVSFTGAPPIYRNPIKIPKKLGPLGEFTNIPIDFINFAEKKANLKGISTGEYLMKLARFVSKVDSVEPVASKSANIGNVKVTTLIDGEQYFTKALSTLKSAKESILLRMFEFQNVSVDGDIWPAVNSRGAKEQQQLLKTLVKKKETNPDMKIQVILDAHKWYIDGNGNKTKHYANQKIIKYLKEHGIDVVPAPRGAQQGSQLEHTKLLIVDKSKALLGGMNWGSHSAANHDFCIALEKLEGKKNSEIDNLIQEHFIPDWKFAWQRLGETKLVSGPLDESQQKLYSGLNREIKPESVEYYRLLKDFFDTPEAKNRYREGQLDLIEANPVKSPKIDILATKPKEYEFVGGQGLETIFTYAIDKVKTWNKLRGEFFFATNKEIRKTIIDRFKKGELDVKLILAETDFPYCKKAYTEMAAAGVPVEIYKADKSIKQRMHGKWCVGDDKDVIIGSANWSDQGLTQNITKGMREDYILAVKEIEGRISNICARVKPNEQKLMIPPLSWDGSDEAYEGLKNRLNILKKAYTSLKNTGEARFELDGSKYFYKKDELSVTVTGKKYPFKKEDEKDAFAELRTIGGYYKIVQRQHRSKPKFKRGNNEISVAFTSPSLAKSVFTKQFDRDWNFSKSLYEAIKFKVFPMRKPSSLDVKG